MDLILKGTRVVVVKDTGQEIEDAIYYPLWSLSMRQALQLISEPDNANAYIRFMEAYNSPHVSEHSRLEHIKDVKIAIERGESVGYKFNLTTWNTKEDD